MKYFEKILFSIRKRINLIESFFRVRDDKIVVFGAWLGNKFSCNSRYLYQYLSENKEKLGLKNVVWVTRNEKVYETLNNMGYEVYMFGSKESIYYHKNAGYHIICNSDDFLTGDIEIIYSYGAKCINLWHGLPFKSFGKMSNEYKAKRLKKRFSLDFMHFNKGWTSCYYLSTTKYVTEQFNKCLEIGYDKFIESGYPRNCKEVRLTNYEKKIIEDIKKYNYIFLYLPTFRTGDNVFNFISFSKNLSDILLENNILWIQKAHYHDEQNILKENMSDNVLSLNSDFDINVLMPYIDFLVTDYSSVMFDAMYYRKPILYLIPDIDEYRKGDRGLNLVHPSEVQTGPVFFSINELKEKILYYCIHPEEAFRDDYEKVREMYWGKEEKDISDIWQDIYEKLK